MAPYVFAHHLVVDSVANERGPGFSAHDVVEPVKRQLPRVDLRSRIDVIPAQDRRLYSALRTEMVPRARD